MKSGITGQAASDPSLLTPEEATERQQIVEALDESGWNQRLAAERLGISNRTLVNRLGKYGLPRPRKRS